MRWTYFNFPPWEAPTRSRVPTLFGVSARLASVGCRFVCQTSVTRLRCLLQLLPHTRQFDFGAAGLIKKNEFLEVRQPLLHKFPELVYIGGVVFGRPSECLRDFNGQTRMLPGRQKHRVAQPHRLLLAETSIGFQPAQDHESWASVQAKIGIRVVLQIVG